MIPCATPARFGNPLAPTTWSDRLCYQNTLDQSKSGEADRADDSAERLGASGQSHQMKLNSDQISGVRFQQEQEQTSE